MGALRFWNGRSTRLGIRLLGGGLFLAHIRHCTHHILLLSFYFYNSNLVPQFFLFNVWHVCHRNRYYRKWLIILEFLFGWWVAHFWHTSSTHCNLWQPYCRFSRPYGSPSTSRNLALDDITAHCSRHYGSYRWGQAPVIGFSEAARLRTRWKSCSPWEE